MTTSQLKAIGYCRVSTIDQAQSGISLSAQQQTLQDEALRRGWDLQLITESGSGKNLDRPGLLTALDQLDAGAAHILMAVRLDRISRSVADFSHLAQQAQGSGWRIVLLSPAIDTADPAGAFTIQILSAAAEYERNLAGIRTKEALAHQKAKGVRIGRPRAISAEVEDRIRQDRANGYSLRAIATRLNDQKVPTGSGGRWYASTIKAILERDQQNSDNTDQKVGRSDEPTCQIPSSGAGIG